MSIWQRITGQHRKVSLSDLTPPVPTAPPPAAELRTIEQAQAWLKVRLCAADGLEDGAGQDVLRQDPANGLAAVLTLDLPDGPRDVTAEDAEAWATPIAALFAIALGNLQRERRFDRTLRTLPNGSPLLAFRGENEFTASQLLVVHHLLPAETVYGSLACVPKSDLLLVHPIRDDEALDALEELALLAARMYEAGPQALSPHLYWAEGNRLMRLPVTLGADGVVFKAPPRFAAKVIEPLSGHAG